MLQKINFRPGFNKQDTETGAEGQWTDGDNVRFRYGQPEKIGGWSELVNATLAGPARDQLSWSDLDGRKYAAIGTSKLLVIYYESAFYDITPLEADQSGVTFTTTNGSASVTVNVTAAQVAVGDYVKFKNVTLPGSGTSFVAADFTTNVFEVTSLSGSNAYTITMPSNETSSGISSAGSATQNRYVTIGPVAQTSAFGWGTDTWGSEKWGEASTSSNVTLDPGNWSLDNFGQTLIATIHNGRTFTWNTIAQDGPSAIDTRAVVMTNAPTASVMTLVSDRDRHLFHIGTEETIGNTDTQNKMFIRFSNQEDFNTYTPTATNTAGTFLLDQGNEIIAAVQGKDYVLVLTDQAAYVIQFVGPPFTFSLRQVGSNCGCLSQHTLVYSQGAVYWMGFGGGFFKFDGTVTQLGSLVEDFVFTTGNSNLGINYEASKIAYGEHNSLYNEIFWFYPKAGSAQIDRVVTYNYVENTWATGSLSRTTYQDNHTYPLPYATEFLASTVPSFPVINGVTSTYGATRFWAHETGTNAVLADTTSFAISSYVISGDYDLDAQQGLNGAGENIMRVSRFIPDFKNLQGNAKVTLRFRNYPASSETTDNNYPLVTGPFTINTTTEFKSTRVRGRQVSLKIENDGKGQSWRYGTLRLDIHAGGRR